MTPLAAALSMSLLAIAPSAHAAEVDDITGVGTYVWETDSPPHEQEIHSAPAFPPIATFSGLPLTELELFLANGALTSFRFESEADVLAHLQTLYGPPTRGSRKSAFWFGDQVSLQATPSSGTVTYIGDYANAAIPTPSADVPTQSQSPRSTGPWARWTTNGKLVPVGLGLFAGGSVVGLAGAGIGYALIESSSGFEDAFLGALVGGAIGVAGGVGVLAGLGMLEMGLLSATSDNRANPAFLIVHWLGWGGLAVGGIATYAGYGWWGVDDPAAWATIGGGAMMLVGGLGQGVVNGVTKGRNARRNTVHLTPTWGPDGAGLHASLRF